MAAKTTVRMTEDEYREFALGDKTGNWELVDGLLREKPAMTVLHGRLVFDLLGLIANQLDRNAYTMRISHARLRVSSSTYYVPDLAVIPLVLEERLRVKPHSLDAYSEPLPLVIEVWSSSAGDYDIYQKAAGYQHRGDREIWCLHSDERTLTVWRREPHGTYRESLYRGGRVQPEQLPSIAIDLDALLETNQGR